MPSVPVPAADFLLERMSNALWDPLDPTRLGSLDPKLHTRVNGEIYRFAGRLTLAKFRRDPTRWCGVLRDPVTAVRFMPTHTSPRCDTADGPYFFCSDSSAHAFRAMPEKFAIHR